MIHAFKLLYNIMRPFRKSKRKWCRASQLQDPHDRLEDAVERVRTAYFRAEVLIAIPSIGEMLAVEVIEHGRKLQVSGKTRRVTITAGTFWKLVEAARKADGPPQNFKRINS